MQGQREAQRGPGGELAVARPAERCDWHRRWETGQGYVCIVSPRSLSLSPFRSSIDERGAGMTDDCQWTATTK